MVGKVYASERYTRKVRFTGRFNKIDNRHSIKEVSVVKGPELSVLLDAFRFASGDPSNGVEFEFAFTTEDGLHGHCAAKLVPQSISRDADGHLWVSAVVPGISWVCENDITADSQGNFSLGLIKEGLIDIKYDIINRVGTVVE
ncbi:hypothetical protein GX865_02090 [Candidatus Saccharibacteria bacterium]|jgi:hypothetical protein|nr:hypothetical protein [Candidatus Saccharibacteria bacterium]